MNEAMQGGAGPEAFGVEKAPPAFSEFLQKLSERRDLARAEAGQALEQMMDGMASDVEMGAFLMALRIKGETAEEITGLLETMRRAAIPVETPHPEALVDIVGTGGDRLGTFNISTSAALVVAGAGVKVAKHGNRAASSRCGSADVLEALGVRVDLTPTEVAACLDQVGMGFMLASQYHPAMGRVAGVRSTLGIRTQLEGLVESLGRVKSLRQENRAVCYEKLADLFITYYREHPANRSKGEEDSAALGKRLLLFLMNAKDREQYLKLLIQSQEEPESSEEIDWLGFPEMTALIQSIFKMRHFLKELIPGEIDGLNKEMEHQFNQYTIRERKKRSYGCGY